MRRHRWAAVAGVALMGLCVPVERLPSDWQARYYATFGEPEWTEAPASRAWQGPVPSIDSLCPPEMQGWRAAQTIDGVQLPAVPDCRPDNPWDVAAAVKGTNNVSHGALMGSKFTPDAVEKGEDRDGDGDPDVIHIRLEVMELNGRSPDGPFVVPQFEIAPGITPGFWVFAPKTRGMTTVDFESLEAHHAIRLPAPAIRVEAGDEVSITLENTHYLPHTIHLHGVDHPWRTADGQGNDGVPMFGEMAPAPGRSHTYRFTARHAGTAFYHCHVQPQAHILMGMQGLLIVEENRPDNWLQTINIGAGRVRVPSKAVSERYQREYDLHYLEIDPDLNDRIQHHTDPRLISRSVHREYDINERVARYYVVNGRSFPYTLFDALIIVDRDERALLRVLNGGTEEVALHLHGHKPLIVARDGVQVPASAQIQRDVFSIAGAQRLDLVLDTTNDGLNAYGPGVWMAHDHREKAVTTNAIGDGGDMSLVIYEEFLNEHGLPATGAGLQAMASRFDPAFYRGEVPVFSGMGLPQLDQPDVRASALPAPRTVGFWGGVGLLVWALWPRFGRRSA